MVLQLREYALSPRRGAPPFVCLRQPLPCRTRPICRQSLHLPRYRGSLPRFNGKIYFMGRTRGRIRMTRHMISPFLRFFPGPSGGLGQNDEEGFTHMPIYCKARDDKNRSFVSRTRDRLRMTRYKNKRYEKRCKPRAARRAFPLLK